MSRVRPVRIRRRSALFCLALALAGGPTMMGRSPALAQQAGGLRGPLALERQDPLAPRTGDPLAPDTQQPAGRSPLPQYRPVSPGALPEEQLDERLDRAEGNVDAAEMPRQRRPATNRAALPDGPGTASRDGRPAAERRAPAAAEARPGEEETLTTGTVPARSIDALDLERNTAVPPESQRVDAIETLAQEAEAEPFQPPGIRVGTFVLRPSLEQGIEWTSNATGTAGGSSDYLSESTLRLNAASDWARHSATLDAFGTYRTSVAGTGFSEFRGGADARLRLELGNEFALNSALGYQRRPEAASSPVTIAGTAGRPLRQTLSGSLGLEKSAGRLRLGATGTVTRDIYGDAELSTGGTLSQADRNQTLYALALRGGYEISPALTPFVEVEYGRRIYDNAVDSAGYRRSANRYGVRAGASFDFGEKLNGELSAGWITENPDDPRLGPVSGLSAEGSLLWSPIRGTTVALTGATEIEGSTTPGASGSVLYSSTLGISRELRANLTGTATFGVDWRNYAYSSDRDLTLSGEASLTWWFNRYAGIRGRARHEQTTSTIAGRAAQSTSVYLGVTLRR